MRLAMSVKPSSSECGSEGNRMLHLYSTVLLAVIAANALAVLLAVAIALNSRKRDFQLAKHHFGAR
jgi:hypothetical protein